MNTRCVKNVHDVWSMVVKLVRFIQNSFMSCAAVGKNSILFTGNPPLFRTVIHNNQPHSYRYRTPLFPAFHTTYYYQNEF